MQDILFQDVPPVTQFLQLCTLMVSITILSVHAIMSTLVCVFIHHTTVLMTVTYDYCCRCNPSTHDHLSGDTSHQNHGIP